MQKPFRFAAAAGGSLFFHHTLQWMLVLARKIHHLRHFRFGNFICEYAALPDAMMVNVKHDFRRGLEVLLKEFLQHMNDELHRCVVVIQNQDAVEIGPFGLRLDLGDTDVAGPPVPPVRLSSLPIRGEKTASRDADGSVLVIDLNMARAC